MDNLETQATLGTRATGRRQTAKQQQKQKTKQKTKSKQTKTEKMSNTNPQKTRHVSHIVKDGTNSLDNGGNKNIYVKGKRSIIPGT